MAKQISTDEAEAMIDDDVLYVDVRTEEEFADGHPPGAVNVPLLLSSPNGMVPNDEFSSVVEANFSKDQRLIVGCKAGTRSAQAAKILEQLGYEKVYDMTAGFSGKKDPFGRVVMGWQQEGREIELDAEADQTYAGLKRLALG